MSVTVVQAPKFVHVMPDRSELLLDKTIRCTESGCMSVFKSQSNLTLHLLKIHKKNISLSFREENQQYCFYCPEENCVYNRTKNLDENKNYFTELKHLKQHFRKVHKEKEFECNACSKAFPDEHSLKRHAKVCGQKFFCGICGSPYKNHQSLVYHVKQKSHQFEMSEFEELSAKHNPEESDEVRNKKKSKASQTEYVERKNKKRVAVSQMTQTSASKKNRPGPSKETNELEQKVEAASTQTLPIDLSILDDPLLTYIDSSSQTGHDLTSVLFSDAKLCHIETQTENPVLSDNSVNEMTSDPLLFNHMHTQTSEELLSELSMESIQTQTHWDTEFDFNNYLVSTETQTYLPRLSFSLSNNASSYTQTSQSMEFLNQIDPTFNSIHTQT